MMLPLGLALVASLALSAGSQSLADVARKTQEERQKSTTPAAPVITNGDLKPGRVPAEGTTVDPNASADLLKKPDAKADKSDAAKGEKSDKTDKADAKPALTAKDEAYWRGRFTQLNAWLEENLKKEAAFGSQLLAISAQLANMPASNPARQGLLVDRGKAEMELHAAQAAIKDERAQIKTLEEEGKKAGAPAEWFK